MLERDIEKKTCQYAREKGMLTYKFTSPGQRGVCDRMFIFRGCVFFIEFKAPGKTPTKVQKKHHQQMQAHEISVYVVDGLDQGKKVIDYEHERERTGYNR